MSDHRLKKLLFTKTGIDSIVFHKEMFKFIEFLQTEKQICLTEISNRKSSLKMK